MCFGKKKKKEVVKNDSFCETELTLVGCWFRITPLCSALLQCTHIRASVSVCITTVGGVPAAK